MAELLRLLESIETWVYVILGLVGLFYLRKFIISLEEWRSSVFGLERENAQRRLSEATSVLALTIIIAVGEFFLVTFIAPSVPGVDVFPTPTLNVLATPTVTLSAEVLNPSVTDQILTPDAIDATPQSVSSGCIAGQLNFTSPQVDEEVQGTIVLKGVIQVSDFGYYKYEFSPRDEENWITIAASSQLTTTPEPDGSELGEWDTSTVNEGNYLLRLVVTDHQGNELPACVISIRVIPPSTD